MIGKKMSRRPDFRTLLFNFAYCELVHPVEQAVALNNVALKITADAGNKFLSGHDLAGIDRALLRSQYKCLDPFFSELSTLDKAGIDQFLDNARAFPAVDIEDLPELTLQDPLRL